MFRFQFRMCKEDFYELEKVIKDHKERQGYDMEHHYKYASWSNVSPINLELWLFVMLRLLSGAMYLDMVWYECIWIWFGMKLVFLAFYHYFAKQFVKLMRHLITPGFQWIPLE